MTNYSKLSEYNTAPRAAKVAKGVNSAPLKPAEVLFMMVVETLLLARPLAIDPACTFGAEELADAVVSTAPLASSACIVALKAPVKPVIENLIWNSADQ